MSGNGSLPTATTATTASVPAGGRLQAEDIRLAYDERTVVDGMTLTVPDGRVTAIVGPNACGKSTLLRALSRLLAPAAGTVVLDGADINRLPTREVARRLALLPQTPLAPDGIVVRDLVARGRTPHHRWFQQWTQEDEDAVAGALTATGTLALADRQVDELSGGQRQRVWIAMTLAQHTDLLLLDEPTTFLDIAHQLDVLTLLAQLNAEQGRTVVVVLHDLNLAGRFAHHMIAMRDGEVVASGPPGEVVTPANVARVFGLESIVIPDPVSGSPLVVPVGPQSAGSPESPPVRDDPD